MKRTIFFAFCVLACALFSSCVFDKAPMAFRKVYTPDISIHTVNGTRYAYYNGELYTGDVYSSDEKNKMTIKNGIAIVAYANYGVTSGKEWDKEMKIHEEIYEHEGLRYQENGAVDIAYEIYERKKISALKSLPNCSFAK